MPTRQLPLRSRSAGDTRLPLPAATTAGIAVALIAVTLIAVVTFRALRTREDAVVRFTQTQDLLERLESLQSVLTDAETGQRGFLLTGDETYLGPFIEARSALPGQINAVRIQLGSGSIEQRRRLDVLERLVGDKLGELAQTIELRRNGDDESAVTVVRSNRGKAAMDRIRRLVDEMKDEERRRLADDQRAWQAAVGLSSWVTWGGSTLLFLLIAGAAALMARDYRALGTQIWLRTGQMRVSELLEGDQRVESLGQKVLAFLADYLGARVGAFYGVAADGSFERFAGYALPPGAAGAMLRPDDGLLGQAVSDGSPLHVTQVPDGYLPIASSLGGKTPIELLISPAEVDGAVQGVLELGFFTHVGPADRELVARVSESLAIALRTAKDRSRLEDLLAETQRQSEELQTQQEELRVNNEELEEQGHALRDSQARLETQHSELEQTNTQLEEQAVLLEDQRDELGRAQSILLEKAAELERSNRYKSEFLANMSHELRTPLNSSLILAKLLADNKDGNLSAEQVRFAETISAAGHDLLALINDILDLSRIEAGKVDLDVAVLSIADTVEGLVRTFRSVADQKGLSLGARVEPGCPDRIESDPQRLGQILKNLLSNALKFTHAGGVSLRVSAQPDGMVEFEVSDTGIGIAPEQHGLIFEAFHQADGTTHRKYGGTGLGLSISRDLAHLLGGGISVRSTPGQGSVFTLTVPRAFSAATTSTASPGPAVTSPAPASRAASPRPPSFAVPPRSAHGRPTLATASLLSPAAIDDDRDRLAPGARVVLVIEDDVHFAGILRDMARELGFQCVVTHMAADALAAAALHPPSAIVLDINLPDHSGLGVLDQLKRNPATRHVPVHVLSVVDYSQQALEQGAIGFALKPVKREQLVDAFRHLAARATQAVRRVLVVEDDARQRASVRALLEHGDVEITAVGDAAAALRELAAGTFDCMVLDLTLPDVSGYELLERMAEQDDVAFPPVIVYTGRSLSKDEEQRLRRFSKSIIIKDARSPERLVDEVTLFLHQVESTLSPERRRMLKAARDRESTFEGRRVLVVEDDVRNLFALSSVLEPKGAVVEIARNGREAIDALTRFQGRPAERIDLVLMDIMMPEMDGLTAMREIRTRPEWRKLPIIALTAKAMRDDHEKCLAAGASDYIAKPLDVEKLLSLIRVWMPAS